MNQNPTALVSRWSTAWRAMVLAWGVVMAVQPVRAAEDPSFEIVARDGRLSPEVLEVPSGVKLKLILRNEGKVPVEFENLPLRVEKVLAPNAMAKVTLQPLKPGAYVFVDEFHAETGKMTLQAK